MPLTRLVVLLMQVYKNCQISASPGSNSFPLLLNYGLAYRFVIPYLTLEGETIGCHLHRNGFAGCIRLG